MFKFLKNLFYACRISLVYSSDILKYLFQEFLMSSGIVLTLLIYR